MRRSNALITAVSVILLAAILFYFGANAIDSFLNPLGTTIAVEYTLEDTVDVSGYIVRYEEPMTGSGIISPVADGKKVAAGGVVAVTYSSEEDLSVADEIIETEQSIARLEAGGDSTEGASVAVSELAAAVAAGDLGNLDNLVYNIEINIMNSAQAESDSEEELASLKARLEELNAMQTGAVPVTTDKSGIFSTAVDGLEAVSPDMLTGLTPEGLQALFQSPASISGYFGKLVSGTTWYFAAVMPSERAAEFEAGEQVTVEFTKNYSDTVDMTIEEIGRDSGGQCVVVLSSSRGLADVAPVRTADAEVLISRQTGLSVPEEAIHSDDTGTYVYILMGLQAERVDIEVTAMFGDGMCLIGPAEGETLNEGAEIIVRARNLYDGKVVR